MIDPDDMLLLILNATLARRHLTLQRSRVSQHYSVGD